MKLVSTIFLLCFFCIVSAFSKTSDLKPKLFGPIPTDGQLQWHEMEMYGFVHFSIATFVNKEWADGSEGVDMFNPTNFDVNQIVSAFKAAGLKGIILTCKHHDGFCLWPTKTTDYNISKSPYKNGNGDLVKEFSDACKSFGLKFGVYLSPWDRNDGRYGSPEYLRIYREQLTELLTNYGEVFETWHDGANGGSGFYGGAREVRRIDKTSYYDWANTWSIVRKLQPNAVIFSDIGPDVRWVGNEEGHAGDPCWSTITLESSKPDAKLAPGVYIKDLGKGTSLGKAWIPAEVDFSIRKGWFWRESENHTVKTGIQLVDHYFMSVGRGASMLLNIPPDTRGLLYHKDVESLKIFGQLINEIFAVDLAKGARLKVSNVRSKSKEFAPKNVLDNNSYSYWATADNVKDATLELTLRKAQTFSVFKIRENIKLGHRVNEWAVDVFVDGAWKEYANGKAIGACRLVRGDKVTTNKVRLRLNNAFANPCISEFGIYREPDYEKYKQVMDVKQTNVVDRTKWKVLAANVVELSKALDSNNQTFAVLGSDNAFTLDLGEVVNATGFTFLPRQDKNSNGLIHSYRIQISNDGQNFVNCAEGEFSNIKNNPVQQVVDFGKSHQFRYIRFHALQTEKDAPGTVAEFNLMK